MKWTLAVLLATVAACGSNTVTPQERLMGKWIYSGSSAGIGLEFDTGGTYTYQELQLTSTSTGNDQIETGKYIASDSSIVFTAQQSSCGPGRMPIYTYTYTFNGDSLAVVAGSTAMGFSRNTTPPASNFIISTGCFQSDGSFVVSPLVAVSN